jgi:hypothetical protein
LLLSVSFIEGLRWMTELVRAIKRLPNIGRPLFWPELLLRRQREPELETAGTARVAGSPAVPRSLTCLEPFNAAFCQDASRSGRLRTGRFPGTDTGMSPSRCPSANGGRSPGTRPAPCRKGPEGRTVLASDQGHSGSSAARSWRRGSHGSDGRSCAGRALIGVGEVSA